MKVTYLRLENVAGLIVGSNKDILEISFEKSINKIIAIVSENGRGKSVLISSINPFAYPTSVDERSTLPYIAPHKNGYKEIHYVDGPDKYVIKHYYKANKDSHSVKSYFMKNDEELNENGNVRSFDSLVELHFGLTQEMMRLIRIGTNVNSFISLTPARRKEYIGKLIEEIELYLNIYKKVNEDIRVVRTMIQANNTNLYNCHITDPVVEDEKLSKLKKDIRKYEQERDQIIAKISKINALMKDNDIDDLRRKLQEAEMSIKEYEKLSDRIKASDLSDTSIDDIMKKRSKLMDQKIDIQSRINSFRLAIDSVLKNIERLELNIKKVTSNNDIQSLINIIQNIRDSLNNTPSFITSFTPLGATSDEIHELFTKLQSFNQISQMIYSLGNRPIDVYLKLRSEGISIEKWLKEQAQKNISRINNTDLQVLYDQLFKDEVIISPNCDTEYVDCPFFRLSELMNNIKSKVEEETFNEETLRYIQIISRNIDDILNELDRFQKIKIPDKIKDSFTEKNLLDRLREHLSFFELSELHEYLSIVRDYEIYSENSNKLKQYEYQLSIYQKAGVDNHLEEIKHQRELAEKYKSQISELQVQLSMIQNGLVKVDEEIALLTKFNDSKKYLSLMESTVKSTKKVLIPLETAANEKAEYDFQLRHITNAIASTRDQHRILETKINEYNRLVDEGKKLSKKNKDLSIIMEAVSTKKGIPVFYMKRYLGKIQTLANELLSIIYDDEFKLANFNVTPETFEVPYIKNGRKIPDIKYSSQSEIALATMALSFALATNTNGLYNILLLDEIDAGLDSKNRAAFLKMLYTQMNTIHAEQVFVISHNLSQMVNIPMDCICLSEDVSVSKLQNIIYE